MTTKTHCSNCGAALLPDFGQCPKCGEDTGDPEMTANEIEQAQADAKAEAAAAATTVSRLLNRHAAEWQIYFERKGSSHPFGEQTASWYRSHIHRSQAPWLRIVDDGEDGIQIHLFDARGSHAAKIEMTAGTPEAIIEAAIRAAVQHTAG